VSVLERYPDLTADELSRLVMAASQVLMELGEAERPVPADLLEMAPRAAARMIAGDLPVADASPGRIERLVEDPDSSRAMALKVLGLVRGFPELRALIEQRYDELERKMFVPELMLLTAALVVLAMRIKRLKVGHTEITFYPAGDEVKSFISGMTKGIFD
jgi:hypothetical protein